MYLFQGMPFSGPSQALWCSCYSITHARLSWLGAGDPDRKLERSIVPWDSGISLFYCRNHFLQSWLGVIVLMLWHLHPQDCPNWRLEKEKEKKERKKERKKRRRGRTFFPISNYKSVFIPETSLFSLGVTGRYSAHATASHAQDCPGQKLERKEIY